MSNAESPSTMSDAGATSPRRPRKLRILMLHGYTQSGSIFRSKTNALRKHLEKTFSPSSKKTAVPKSSKDDQQERDDAAEYGGVELMYATAPIRLCAADVPGFEERVSTTNGSPPGQATAYNVPQANDDQEGLDAWGWWRKDHATGQYIEIDRGIDALASILESQGPFDGAIGFSQGAAAAGILASLLEPGRREALARKKRGLAEAGVEGMDFPTSFLRRDVSRSSVAPTDSDDCIIHPPLSFVVAYSGFVAPHPKYSAFYDPPIGTPTLHFIGSLDSVVEEHRSLALVDACRSGKGGSHGDSTSKQDRPPPSRLPPTHNVPTSSCSTSNDARLEKQRRRRAQDPRVIYHPGGHFVPSQRQYLDQLVHFLKDNVGLVEPV